jgi:hypothetical protein
VPKVLPPKSEVPAAGVELGVALPKRLGWGVCPKAGVLEPPNSEPAMAQSINGDKQGFKVRCKQARLRCQKGCGIKKQVRLSHQTMNLQGGCDSSKHNIRVLEQCKQIQLCLKNSVMVLRDQAWLNSTTPLFLPSERHKLVTDCLLVRQTAPQLPGCCQKRKQKTTGCQRPMHTVLQTHGFQIAGHKYHGSLTRFAVLAELEHLRSVQENPENIHPALPVLAGAPNSPPVAGLLPKPPNAGGLAAVEPGVPKAKPVLVAPKAPVLVAGVEAAPNGLEPTAF